MKKRIIILGAIVLLVAAAWTGTWYFFAGQLRQQIELLAFADGESSPQLVCETLDVSGYPFRFDVDCANAALVSGDLLVEIPGLRASVMVYRPNHILASALGPAQVSDAFTGHRSAVEWGTLEGSLRIESWRIARLSVIGDTLRWTDRLVGNDLIASAPHVEFHLLDMPEAHVPERGLAALAGFMRAEKLAMPGLAIADADIEVEAEMTALPDDIRNLGSAPFLPAWQRDNGLLRIVGVRARDASADLVAHGEISLDAGGYPTGSISVDSAGLAERIAPLIEEPWRTLVLGMPGPDGRHKNQINLREGVVYSGLLPISGVPSLL